MQRIYSASKRRQEKSWEKDEGGREGERHGEMYGLVPGDGMHIIYPLLLGWDRRRYFLYVENSLTLFMRHGAPRGMATTVEIPLLFEGASPSICQVNVCV